MSDDNETCKWKRGPAVSDNIIVVRGRGTDRGRLFTGLLLKHLPASANEWLAVYRLQTPPSRSTRVSCACITSDPRNTYSREIYGNPGRSALAVPCYSLSVYAFRPRRRKILLSRTEPDCIPDSAAFCPRASLKSRPPLFPIRNFNAKSMSPSGISRTRPTVHFLYSLMQIFRISFFSSKNNRNSAELSIHICFTNYTSIVCQ